MSLFIYYADPDISEVVFRYEVTSTADGTAQLTVWFQVSVIMASNNFCETLSLMLNLHHVCNHKLCEAKIQKD